MKVAFALTLLLATSMAGCGHKPSPDKPMVEVRGEPIVPAGAGAAAATRPAASVSAARSALPGDRQADSSSAYPLAGFDKLSGYSIEISDELLGPVTNDQAAITAKTDAL